MTSESGGQGPGNVSPDLLKVQSSAYRPPRRSSMNPLLADRPLFSLLAVEAMRQDPAIRLGMALKRAPLFHLKFTSSADAPEVKKFVDDTATAFWLRAMPKVVNALWYSRSGSEVVYRMENGQVRFHGLKQFYPSDFEILTSGGSKWGLKVRGRRSGAGDGTERPGDTLLPGMKSFLYVHGREFGSWDGRSDFEAAWDSWNQKHGYGGAIAIRKLWFFKNAFHSNVIFHPVGEYVWTDADGNQVRIPYRDLARQAVEQSATGAVWTLPNTRDEDGNSEWSITPPSINGNGGEMIQYPKELDTEMLRAMEIPDDIVQQVSGTGSWAGRTIPMKAFLSSQTVVLQEIFHEFCQQILEPLLYLNFGHISYKAENVGIDEDALMPSPPSQGNPQKPDARSMLTANPTVTAT